MRFRLIPDQPFSNVSGDDNFVVHPMRGESKNIALVARITGLDRCSLVMMRVGDEKSTRHGKVRRVS